MIKILKVLVKILKVLVKILKVLAKISKVRQVLMPLFVTNAYLMHVFLNEFVGVSVGTIVFVSPSQTCKLASLICWEINFFYPAVLAISVASFNWKAILTDWHYFPNQKTLEKLLRNEKSCNKILKNRLKWLIFTYFVDNTSKACKLT